MSNLTQIPHNDPFRLNPIKWENIPADKQKEIVGFYRTLWTNAINNFVLNNLQDIVNAIKKADKQFGCKSWYLSFHWESSESDDNAYNVSIGYQSYDAITSITELNASGFLDFCKKHDNPETLIIYSHHSYEPGTPTMSFGVDSDGVEYSVFVSELPINSITLTLPKQLIVDAGRESIARSHARNQSKSKKDTVISEQNREDDLYDWLRLNGVDAERQIQTTSKHCIDLWIPNKLMIELKKSAVSGNDICQCIEYASEYKLPIILIGDKLTTAASRGMKGFNKLCPEHKITFISWDSAKDYLRGVLRLI